ncbi:MAG: tetratricopeptide repeat protein [Saprospiraceae bacterium]|nr:tetratricopeptide repeat protein [Saprospiraceae bacterium]
MNKKSKKVVRQEEVAVQTAPTGVSRFSFFENPWLPPLLLITITALTYFSSLENGFVAFDDDKSIWYNPHLKSPSFKGIFGEQLVGMYVPITSLVYVLVYQLFGENAQAYHLISLLVHLLNVWLVFRLIGRIQDKPWVAFFAAFMFGVHPMLSEPISWVSALSTLLFSCFYLIALHLFWTFLENKGQRFYWYALGVFVLAGLSKSAAATLPAALVVLDWWRNKKLNGQVIFQKWPFWLISAGLIILTFITRTAEGHDIGGGTTSFSMIDRLFMISHTVFFYPVKLLIPFSYSILYPFVKTQGAWRADYYLALPALLFLMWWVIKNWEKQREIILGIGLYLAPLFLMLPVVSVGTAEMRNDRYAYLPSIGIFLLLLLAANRIKSTALRYGLLAAFCGLLVFQGMQQSMVWKDGTSLFKNCVDKTPDAALCQCNLGYSELLALQFDQSVEHYTNALQLDTTYVEAYNGRGQAYLNLDKIPQALDDFSRAIQAGIVTPKLFFNRGKCYAILKRYSEAIPDFNKSIDLEPKSAETWYFRAFSLEKTSDPAKAIADYSEAIRLNPNYVEALVNRGLMYYQQQRYPEAIADDSKALSIAAAGIKPMILVNRANAYFQMGNHPEALNDVNNALQLNPNYPRAYQSRAAIFLKMGLPDKAQADLSRSQTQ